MNRFGVIIALLLLAALIGVASLVRIKGPGRAGPDEASGPQVSRTAPSPSGALVMPVQGVVGSALTDSWSEPRGGGVRAHHAIDIIAPIGSPVLAVADGRIEKLYESDLGGHTIYERSADGGTVYYYAHIDHYVPTLFEGQVVRAGQPIAAVGSSGDADPGAPHLHFEIHRVAAGEGWWQGEEIDPYPLLAGTPRR